MTADNQHYWCISSPVGTNRVNAFQSVRREALKHAMSFGEYEDNFDAFLRWKGTNATIGSVRIELKEFDK